MKNLPVFSLAFFLIVASCKKDAEPANQQLLPVLTTVAASDITTSTIRSGGVVTSDGGAAITTKGTCWSIHPEPTISDSKTNDGSGTGTFVSNITGLTASTTYYLRAYATNQAGTGYGNSITCTTAPEIMIDYLGQSPPGNTPIPFAHHIFSNFPLHSCPAFSPCGNWVFWSSFNFELTGNYKLQLWCMKRGESGWSNPMVADFLLDGIGDSPIFSPDGEFLFFLSGVPVNPPNNKENLYCSKKTENGWSSPTRIGGEFDEYIFHWQVTQAANGNLYLSGDTLNQNAILERDIYLVPKSGAGFGGFVNLGSAVNLKNEIQCTPWIAPDERYLIFSRGGNDEFSDLYICYKNPDGNWTSATAMTGINSQFHDLNPIVTPDGKYLMYTSEMDGGPYWVDASVIQQYK